MQLMQNNKSNFTDLVVGLVFPDYDLISGLSTLLELMLRLYFFEFNWNVLLIWLLSLDVEALAPWIYLILCRRSVLKPMFLNWYDDE